MDLLTLRETIINSTRDDWTNIQSWGAAAGPAYHYGLSSELSDDHGIQTEVRSHSNLAVYLQDIDISIAWGYDPDESLLDRRLPLDFTFLPELDDMENNTRGYADVFYRGALVDRLLYVVADGARYFVPIPRRVYPNKQGLRNLGEPEYHYTRWELGFIDLVHSFEHQWQLSDVLERMQYVVDDD